MTGPRNTLIYWSLIDSSTFFVISKDLNMGCCDGQVISNNVVSYFLVLAHLVLFLWIILKLFKLELTVQQKNASIA